MDRLTRLAENARAGDKASLDDFIEATYEQVWRLCATLVDRQSADDLAQKTFIRAVGALASYRGASSARTWLLAIARHTCLDELRSEIRRRRRDSGRILSDTDEISVGDIGEELVVADLVSRLDPDRRTAFVLTQMLGLSYAETADICECPLGTVRSRVARARSDLLRHLEEGEQRRAL